LYDVKTKKSVIRRFGSSIVVSVHLTLSWSGWKIDCNIS